MPKSMKVSVQLGAPAAASGRGVTKRFPGWGSAWKKASVKICCR